MPYGLMILMALHVLTAIFWAGSTFTLARAGGVGADPLFRPQMGAAVVVFLSGAGLWSMLHSGGVDNTSDVVLMIGIVAAVIAAGLQGAMRRRPAVSQRAAALLLALTAICMAIARFVS